MTPAARSRWMLFAGSFAVLLFFLHILGALAGMEAWIVRILAPAEASLSQGAVSLRQTLSAPWRVSGILQENESLRKERDDLLVEVASLHGVQDENTSLHALLQFSKNQPKPPVIAHIIASTPDAGTHTVLLDRGSDDGLQLNLP